MANGLDPKPNSDQVDRILTAVERLVNKKLESDEISHRETIKVNTKSTIGGYLAVAITLGVGAGGIIADTYLKNRDRDEQTLREANQRKLAIIGQISGAITSMRELKDIATISCHKKHTIAEKLALKEERIRRGFELVRVSRPMLHYLDENFKAALAEFLLWEESIPDYCSPLAPKEEEWIKKQREIENKMIISPTAIFADVKS